MVFTATTKNKGGVCIFVGPKEGVYNNKRFIRLTNKENMHIGVINWNEDSWESVKWTYRNVDCAGFLTRKDNALKVAKSFKLEKSYSSFTYSLIFNQ